jgi:hypothetical protein
MAAVRGRRHAALTAGLSEREIRAIIPVGGSRIARLRKVLEFGIETLHTRREPAKPWHAFSEQDIATFKSHCATWIGSPAPIADYDNTSPRLV